ncbi:hypothetical protein BDY24DRAFT_438957 [Mrakia frigida]|uniref:zinc-binding alcohol dehydrogenase family protein n=1 Tax=Mrakia frigida TaxID=29902 RepID=UPI003FCC20FA
MVAVPAMIPALVLNVSGKLITPGMDLREVLKVTKVPLPDLLERETLVEVKAVAVDSTDLACLQLQKKGTTPGFDIAGVVVRSSSGAWRKGDRVFGMVIGGLGSTLMHGYDRKRHSNSGSFSNYARVHTDFLVRLPDEVPFEAAPSVFSALVAFQAFNFHAWPPTKISKGKWILITGGSSIVGMSAIQIAHLVGYNVITTCSGEHLDECKAMGADFAFDYKTPQVDQIIKAMTGDSLSFAIDAVSRGNSTTTAYKAMSSAGGTISTVLPREERIALQLDDSELKKNSRISIEMKLPTTLFGYDTVWHGVDYYPSPGEHHRAQRFLTSLGDWLWQKKWVPLPQTVDQEEGIDALVHAMERVRTRGTEGKTLVVKIGKT